MRPIQLARLIVLVFAAATSLAFLAPTGCAASRDKVPAGPELEGTAWELAWMNGDGDTPPDAGITLFFENRQAAGNAGVNRYSGPVQVAPGEKATIAIGPAVSTKMGGPPEAMRREVRYLALLAQSDRYGIGEDGLLRLYWKDEELLRFKKAQVLR